MRFEAGFRVTVVRYMSARFEVPEAAESTDGHKRQAIERGLEARLHARLHRRSALRARKHVQPTEGMNIIILLQII
jgi:hypothetical protein